VFGIVIATVVGLLVVVVGVAYSLGRAAAGG